MLASITSMRYGTCKMYLASTLPAISCHFPFPPLWLSRFVLCTALYKLQKQSRRPAPNTPCPSTRTRREDGRRRRARNREAGESVLALASRAGYAGALSLRVHCAHQPCGRARVSPARAAFISAAAANREKNDWPSRIDAETLPNLSSFAVPFSGRAYASGGKHS